MSAEAPFFDVTVTRSGREEPVTPDTMRDATAAPPISEVVDHEAEERPWMAACIRLKLAAKEPEGTPDPSP